MEIWIKLEFDCVWLNVAKQKNTLFVSVLIMCNNKIKMEILNDYRLTVAGSVVGWLVLNGLDWIVLNSGGGGSMLSAYTFYVSAHWLMFLEHEPVRNEITNNVPLL